jgi:hypothetical protein
MLEKSSTIYLTESEVNEIKQGSLPKRLETEWGFSLNDAKELVLLGQYVVSGATGSCGAKNPSSFP